MRISPKSFFLTALFIVIIAAAFAWSLHVREPYLGDTGDFGSVLQWTLQWYHEGPIALKFGLFDHFRALETPTLALRDDYASYPAGLIVVPWAVASILHIEPTAAFISIIDMASQLVLALTLSAIAVIFAMRFRCSTLVTMLVALAPALITLWSRGPMNYFMIYHVHDVAVLPWTALFLFTEAVLDDPRASHRPYIAIVQQVAAFIGAYTDWFFFFVLAMTTIKRLAFGEIARRTWWLTLSNLAALWSGAALAMSIYFYSVTELDRWSKLWSRFLERTAETEGISVGIARLGKRFWDNALDWNFNALGARIIWITYGIIAALIIALLVLAASRRTMVWLRPQTRRLLAFVLILMIAPLLQVYTFSEHTYNHLWSGLKFVIVIGLVPFALAPILLVEALRDMGVEIRAIRMVQTALASGLILLACQYAAVSAKTLLANFDPPEFAIEAIGQTIRKHERPSDIIVSPDIEAFPKSVIFAYTRRVVYPAENPYFPVLIANCLGVSPDVLVVFAKPTSEEWLKALRQASSTSRDGSLTFVRIPANQLRRNLMPDSAENATTAVCARIGLHRISGEAGG